LRTVPKVRQGALQVGDLENVTPRKIGFSRFSQNLTLKFFPNFLRVKETLIADTLQILWKIDVLKKSQGQKM